jgi:hypothetical protein
VLRQLGDLSGAEEALLEALGLAEQLHQPLETAKSHVELGHLFAARQVLSARSVLAAASTHYQAAIDLAMVTNIPVLAAAQAGLAMLYSTQQPTTAWHWAKDCAHTLLTQPLDNQYDVAVATLHCYEVFKAAHDPRAATLVQRVCAWIEERSLQISDETLRQSFLERVAVHRRLRELARALPPVDRLPSL